MPELTGVELAKRMYAIRPDITVIFLTGHGTEAMNVEPLAGYEYTIISKPISLKQFGTMLNEWAAEH